MGMGVPVVRGAMGSPAGMPHAYMAGYIFIRKKIFEIIYLACYFIDVDMLAVLIQQGNARAVISPVFQSLQSFEQDGVGIFFADIRYYSTHKFRFSGCFDISLSNL